MFIGNTEITREDMPSYQVGGNYQDRLYQIYQDIIAAKKQQNIPMQPAQQPAQAPSQMAQ